MHVAPQLEILPSEVIIVIMQLIPSPIDLQSVITASPVMFQHYLAHRPIIMTPIIHRIEASYSAKDRGNNRIHITKTLPYRLLGRPVVPQEDYDWWPFAMYPSELLCYRNWGSHLPLICELYRQRREADHLITEYSTEAWKRLLSWEEEFMLRRNPYFDGPLILLEQETYNLERGFLLFESWRLGMYSGGPDKFYGLGSLKDYSSRQVLAQRWDSFGTGIQRSRDCGYLDSILVFVFRKFRVLVHLVSQQLQKDPSKSPTMSSTRNNPTSEFLRRTEDEEVRYISSLCSRGYGMLQNLRQMKEEELQNYVLSSYVAFANQDARLRASPESSENCYIDGQLSLRLKIIFGDIEDLRNPLTRGFYFWDEGRKWWWPP